MFYFTYKISRIIIITISRNIRQQSIITKIYGGANARPLLFKLLIPPGKNVLGYKEKNYI